MLTSCRGLKNKGYSASFVTTSLGRGVRQFSHGLLLRLFVSFTLAFYLLRDDYKIAQWFRRSFEHQPAAVTFVEQVDADLTTIYTGNLITIGASGLLAVSTYYVLDIIAPAGTGVHPVPPGTPDWSGHTHSGHRYETHLLPLHRLPRLASRV